MYNEALLICGERQLSATTGLTEATESRYLLDHVWNNGGVDNCLSSGQWRFAMRTIELGYTSTVEPQFGLTRAFIKPTDWVATSALSADEYFNAPLLNYVDEAGYWYADVDTLYVRFVSNGDSYGNNITSWPAKFSDFVAAHFASKIILKLTSDEDKRTGVFNLRSRALLEAKNHDAMGDPTRFPPSGSWVNARRGGTRRDKGSRHNLIG